MKYRFIIALLSLTFGAACSSQQSGSGTAQQISSSASDTADASKDSAGSEQPKQLLMELLGDYTGSSNSLDDLNRALTSGNLAGEKMVVVNGIPHMMYETHEQGEPYGRLVIKYFDGTEWQFLKGGSIIRDGVDSLNDVTLISDGTRLFLAFKKYEITTRTSAIVIKEYSDSNSTWVDFATIDVNKMDSSIVTFLLRDVQSKNAKLYFLISSGNFLYRVVTLDLNTKSVNLVQEIIRRECGDNSDIFWFNEKLYVGCGGPGYTMALLRYNDSDKNSFPIWETVGEFKQEKMIIHNRGFVLGDDGIHVILEKFDLTVDLTQSPPRGSTPVGITRIIEKVFNGTEWIEVTPTINYHNDVYLPSFGLGRTVGESDELLFYHSADIHFKGFDFSLDGQKPVDVRRYIIYSSFGSTLLLYCILDNALFVGYRESYYKNEEDEKAYKVTNFYKVVKFTVK